ncbi:protein KRI1 homolog [Musca domestica]|uniref:Protein KRI1 homolog n=1 Tax=Musca domestica TaxID=7370 RepID=A0A9J7I7G2_MUSDO|nr:protein KRI1 homolog [Musca domestica]
MSKKLFDDSDDNAEDHFQLNTNEGYAKTYNQLRKKELLQKFKDKGISESDSESSSDSDSSEEDEVLDPTFDQEFLSTLASLKSKDPKIYDKGVKFFEKVNKQIEAGNSDDGGDDSEDGKQKSKEKKTKPVTLKDYERQIILEKGGKFVDDSDEEDVDNGDYPRSASPTLVEEERHLKEEFKKVVNADDSGDEEFGGIFKKREKTKAEEDKEEEDYLKWLAGKKDTIEKEAQEKLKPLKKYWNSDSLPSSEKFLRDYILNKGYTEASNYAEIPTYEEIVGDNAPLSEDEQELEKQAEFEHKFNFRFEDPDQEFIKRYPRTVESSVRRTDDKRKQKRQEVKERKQQEKQEKMKEIEMIKEMKRKEIQDKIEKLKKVTGNDELGFKDDDLDEEFDPEAHDRRMRELFNDDYYQVDEGEEKPECPSDIEELKIEDWDNYDPQEDWEGGDEEDYEPHCEDDDFNMDCDYDPAKAKEQLQKELIENTKTRKGRKGRRDRFMAMIKAEKPVFDPEDEKTYEEYIDEYYKLDCEDIIGDLPCRFKYVETTPNDFGLSIEEILLAKNKELNQWASLKKAIQIRPEQVEKKEQRLYKLKAKNEDLKRKIFKSLYGEGSDNEGEDEVKNETETKSETNPDNNTTSSKTTNETSETIKNKRKRKRKGQNAAQVSDTTATTTVDNTNKDPVKTINASEGEPIEKKAKTEEGSERNTSIVKQTDDNPVVKKKRNKKKKNSQVGDDQVDKSIDNKQQDKPQSHIAKPQHPKETVKQKNTSANSTPPKKSNNPFSSKNNAQVFQNKNKMAQSKGNPFNSTQNKSTNGTLPPLRQNQKKSKPFNAKFGSNKRPFNAKPNGVKDSNDKSNNITDERLKAYGINPKKFHKKQKYGGVNKQQKQN